MVCSQSGHRGYRASCIHVGCPPSCENVVGRNSCAANKGGRCGPALRTLLGSLSYAPVSVGKGAGRMFLGDQCACPLSSTHPNTVAAHVQRSQQAMATDTRQFSSSGKSQVLELSSNRLVSGIVHWGQLSVRAIVVLMPESVALAPRSSGVQVEKYKLRRWPPLVSSQPASRA